MPVRISVANLVAEMAFVDPLGHNEATSIAILNPNGKRFQALGGAAHLTEGGLQFLEGIGVKRSEIERDGDKFDARFILPDDGNLDRVLERFATPWSGVIERGSLRELTEELTKSIAGHSPVLTLEEVLQLKEEYLETVRQPPPKDGKGTSDRARRDMGTRRIFHRHRLKAPNKLKERFDKADQICYPSDNELATTKGGRCRGQLESGAELADNVF